MTTHHCLSCDKELTDQYCSGCGQKVDSHGISCKHLILLGVLRGTFCFEKEILLMAKLALPRPVQRLIIFPEKGSGIRKCLHR